MGRPWSTIGADLENNPPSDLHYHGDAAGEVIDAGKLATLAKVTLCYTAGGGRDSGGRRPRADGCWTAVGLAGVLAGTVFVFFFFFFNLVVCLYLYVGGFILIRWSLAFLTLSTLMKRSELFTSFMG